MKEFTLDERVRRQILTKGLDDTYTQKSIAKEIDCNQKSVGKIFALMTLRKEHKVITPYKHGFGALKKDSCHVYQRLKDYPVRIPTAKKVKSKAQIKIDTSDLLRQFAAGGNIDAMKGSR